jgi:hypothetical protein
MSVPNAASSNPVTAAHEVLEHFSARKVDGVLLDAMTARAIVTVAHALTPESRAKFEAMDVERAARIAWKLVS